MRLPEPPDPDETVHPVIAAFIIIIIIALIILVGYLINKMFTIPMQVIVLYTLTKENLC